MQGHEAEPSRRGKRKSDSVDRNPAALLAQARATQVHGAQTSRVLPQQGFAPAIFVVPQQVRSGRFPLLELTRHPTHLLRWYVLSEADRPPMHHVSSRRHRAVSPTLLAYTSWI
jgi:hypothetical protein